MIVACALHFCAVAAIVYSRTLVDQFFLANYPASTLPLFFIGETVATILLAFLVDPLVSRPNGGVLALALLAASFALGGLALSSERPPVYLALALWLSAASMPFGLVAWNVLGDAFDMRSFKRAARFANVSGSTGAFVAGTGVSLLAAHLSDGQMLYALAALSLATALLPTLLTDMRQRVAAPQTTGANPIRHPLFRNMAAMVVLLLIADTLIDYCLKATIAQRFDGDGIARFMGPFYGLTSAATLALQLFVANRLVHAFGVIGLLATGPLFCAIGSISVGALPSLWTVALLHAGQSALYYGAYNVGREIVVRPLPSGIRRKAKTYIKGFVEPAASALASVVLWVLRGKATVRWIAWGIVPISVVWGLLLLRTRRLHSGAIEDAVRKHRLAPAEDDDDSVERLAAMEAIAEHALATDDRRVLLYGLDLIRGAPGTSRTRALVAKLLAHPAVEVRRRAAETVVSFPDRRELAAEILARLDQEDDADTLWQLALALSAEHITGAPPPMSNAPSQVQLAASVLFAARSGRDASEALESLAQHDDPQFRNYAARLIATEEIVADGALLRRLLHDDDQAVSRTALLALAQERAIALLDDVLSMLASPVAQQAIEALVALGDPATEPLRDLVLSGNSDGSSATLTQRRNALRALAMIAGDRADAALVDLLERLDDPLLQLALARRLTRRSLNGHRLSASLKRALLKAAAAESERLLALRTATDDQGLSCEISQRRALFGERLGLWIAAYSRSRAAISAARLLARSAPEVAANRSATARLGTALELLDALSPNADVRRAVAAFEPGRSTTSKNSRFGDSYLDWFAAARQQNSEKNPMEISERIVLLRQVDLFAGLPGEMLRPLAEVCSAREVAADEVVFEENDPADGMYIVASGSVAIKRGPTTLTVLQRPDFFGEVGLLDDAPRMAGAIARESGLLLFVDRDVFEQLTEDHPEVLRGIIRTLIAYLKDTTQAKKRRTSGWIDQASARSAAGEDRT